MIYFAKWMCHTGYANISLPIMICDSYHAFNKCSKCGKPIQFIRCQYLSKRYMNFMYYNEEPEPEPGTGS